MYKVILSISVPTRKEARLVAERLKNSANADFGEYDVVLGKIEQINNTN